jgi:hypothetical protein
MIAVFVRLAFAVPIDDRVSGANLDRDCFRRCSQGFQRLWVAAAWLLGFSHGYREEEEKQKEKLHFGNQCEWDYKRRRVILDV